MPAYNAACYLDQSIGSILGQTFPDFELIVVDDASTDETAGLLAGYRDRRLRVLRNQRNLGVVGARNRAMDAARGEYIASFDADDVSLPTRLAKQVAFLDANPSVAVLGTASRYFGDGSVRPGRSVADPTPMLVRWMLHVGNPMVHPSLMLRAGLTHQLGPLLREAFAYAEDFDLHHRVLRIAEITVLEEPLLLYRRHPDAITVRYGAEVNAQAAKVLSAAYRRWFGADAVAAASLVALHLLACKPATEPQARHRLGEILSRLLEGFLDAHPTEDPDRDRILRHAGQLWWQVVRAAVRSGCLSALREPCPAFAWPHRAHFLLSDALPSAASGLIPFKPTLMPLLRSSVATMRRR